jgi:hypothetical protein
MQRTPAARVLSGMRFLLAALLLLPTLAHADDRTVDAQKMNTDDCARARKQNKPCVLDMGSETIEAGVKTPEGSGVNLIGFIKAESMIRLRRDFIVEILKSAEDL